VPSEILEKAFADTLPLLQAEIRQKSLFDAGGCTDEEVSQASQASRKHFVTRVRKYGDGNWGQATIIKQYRRRKWWWLQEASEQHTASGLSI
jgi:hypothetical protein